jgi:hypothetical protein
VSNKLLWSVVAMTLTAKISMSGGKTCLNATLSTTNYMLKQRQKQETETRKMKTQRRQEAAVD